MPRPAIDTAETSRILCKAWVSRKRQEATIGDTMDSAALHRTRPGVKFTVRR